MCTVAPPPAPVGTLRVVLGDQCSRTLSALSDLDPATDVVLMAEVQAECTYVKHHQKKIVLVLSAMRHFARALARPRRAGATTFALDDPDNTGHPARGGAARRRAPLRPDSIVSDGTRGMAGAGTGHEHHWPAADRDLAVDIRDRHPLPVPTSGRSAPGHAEHP